MTDRNGRDSHESFIKHTRQGLLIRTFRPPNRLDCLCGCEDDFVREKSAHSEHPGVTLEEQITTSRKTARFQVTRKENTALRNRVVRLRRHAIRCRHDDTEQFEVRRRLFGTAIRSLKALVRDHLQDLFQRGIAKDPRFARVKCHFGVNHILDPAKRSLE